MSRAAPGRTLHSAAEGSGVWREGYVPGGSTRFFVRVLGSPPWREVDAAAERDDELCVLLHGWPQDGSAWRRVAPLLADAGYRVACPDLKGFGRSDAPRRGYDAQTLADEVSQLIRNLHARKAVLVGHDWGGAVALATAFRHPGRVRALVLASTPFRQLDLRAAWHIPLINVPLLPEVIFGAAGGPILRRAIRYAAQVQEPFTDEVLDTYVTATSTRHAAWMAYYRTLSRQVLVSWAGRRVRTRLGVASGGGPNRLRVPATVVWGEQDPVTPVHLAGRVAHDLDARLVTLPGVGHFVAEEDPLGFARAVIDLVGPGAGVSPPRPAAGSA